MLAVILEMRKPRLGRLEHKPELGGSGMSDSKPYPGSLHHYKRRFRGLFGEPMKQVFHSKCPSHSRQLDQE